MLHSLDSYTVLLLHYSVLFHITLRHRKKLKIVMPVVHVYRPKPNTNISAIIIGYRLNMAKYARPRSLSGTADWACEVCFRSKTEGGHILPYSFDNLFITYFTTELTFWKLSYCNLKLSGIWLIRLEKIAERFCWIKTTSKHCRKTMSAYWHQKTINGDRRCCPWALCSGCFDLLAPPTSFIRIWHDAMLLTLGFDMSKSFESSCEKLL